MMTELRTKIGAIVIGASAGGYEVLNYFCSHLPASFRVPVIIAQHLNSSLPTHLPALLGERCLLPVREIEDKDPMCAGTVYTAPANYHVLIEKDSSFALSVDEKVSYSRPSIDVLFQSAASALGSRLIGIILSGANHDGATGLSEIKNKGGIALVQSPEEAAFSFMPQAALNIVKADYVGPIHGIVRKVLSLAENSLTFRNSAV